MSRAGPGMSAVVLPVAVEDPRDGGADSPPKENIPRSCRGGTPRSGIWRRTAPWNNTRHLPNGVDSKDTKSRLTRRMPDGENEGVPVTDAPRVSVADLAAGTAG